MALAIELERHYSKSEILEMYFNQIWFGGSVYGVEAAAEKYFGKTAARMKPVECATIGAMLANPSYYSPYNHPDRLLTRRDFYLTKMFRLGCISQKELDSDLKKPLVVLPPGAGGNLAPYFVEEVRRYMVDKYGADFVYKSGAVIHTTLDLDMQQAANLALLSHLRQLEKDYRPAQIPARRAGGDGRPHRVCPRAHRWPRLQAQRVRPRHPGEATGRVRVQTVRLRRRGGQRCHRCGHGT